MRGEFTDEQWHLVFRHNEAAEQAQMMVEEEKILRIVEAIARHLPSQAEAIRSIGAHVIQDEQENDDCPHLIPPWTAFTWSPCVGLELVDPEPAG